MSNFRKIALVDDHVLLRKALALLVESLGDYKIVFQADNGKEMIHNLGHCEIPELVLMDINMPVMDGFTATQWLKKNHPKIKVLSLSMLDSETAIIKMIQCGARGYVLKDGDPEELKKAIEYVLDHGYFINEQVDNEMLLKNQKIAVDLEAENNIKLSEREIEFFRWVCSDKTYKEIAEEMNVSPRTVENYRDSLYKKLRLTTRIGLVLYAIKNHLVELAKL